MSAYTEAEAKQKWCPFARTTMYVRGDMPKLKKPVDLIGHAANRLVTDDPKLNERIKATIEKSGATRCLGSACMAWRFAKPERATLQTWQCADPRAPNEPTRPPNVPSDAEFEAFDGDYPARWIESRESLENRQAALTANPKGGCALMGDAP